MSSGFRSAQPHYHVYDMLAVLLREPPIPTLKPGLQSSINLCISLLTTLMNRDTFDDQSSINLCISLPTTFDDPIKISRWCEHLATVLCFICQRHGLYIHVYNLKSYYVS